MITTSELLKKTRRIKGLTLTDVETATKIRKKYLIALEAGDWSAFPSRTYSLGIIKVYGDYLGIDKEMLSAFFRREYEKQETTHFKKRLHSSHFAPNTVRFIKLILVLVILAFSLYFGYQIKLYLSPPEVVLLYPKQTFNIRGNKIELVGKADPETIIFINGEQVFLDENNNFRTTVPLPSKKNKVIIEATGANGKKVTFEKIFETVRTPSPAY